MSNFPCTLSAENLHTGRAPGVSSAGTHEPCSQEGGRTGWAAVAQLDATGSGGGGATGVGVGPAPFPLPLPVAASSHPTRNSITRTAAPTVAVACIACFSMYRSLPLLRWSRKHGIDHGAKRSCMNACWRGARPALPCRPRTEVRPLRVLPDSARSAVSMRRRCPLARPRSATARRGRRRDEVSEGRFRYGFVHWNNSV